ncbi:RhoGAP domain-containing protein [Reticulomyxa filosa]|uniref:RhoGAP domain-containing protein n=1 Tax=Reticulomyxa filosa TaxID=46433 RepID=X6PDL4_RETFI|nr:RhoGAP domain-containing protein [Reticulomyxa filosa]|eukprot:ETO36198.1 RhoGAP domain-containing protein [Reticulomyxa filosa]
MAQQVWVEHVDICSGMAYWENPVTKTISFTKPKNSVIQDVNEIFFNENDERENGLNENLSLSKSTRLTLTENITQKEVMTEALRSIIMKSGNDEMPMYERLRLSKLLNYWINMYDIPLFPDDLFPIIIKYCASSEWKFNANSSPIEVSDNGTTAYIFNGDWATISFGKAFDLEFLDPQKSGKTDEEGKERKSVDNGNDNINNNNNNNNVVSNHNDYEELKFSCIVNMYSLDTQGSHVGIAFIPYDYSSFQYTANLGGSDVDGKRTWVTYDDGDLYPFTHKRERDTLFRWHLPCYLFVCSFVLFATRDNVTPNSPLLLFFVLSQ